MSVSPEQPKDIEVELRTYDVDGEALRETLRTLGAVSLGEQVYKRAVLDVRPVDPNKWIRLRSNGSETTLAVKQRQVIQDGVAIGMDGEVEEKVESFETTLQLLSLMGFKARSLQESRSDIYTLDGAEVSIDSWPGMKELLEIEAKDASQSVENRTALIHQVAEKLGVSIATLTTESIEQHYLDTLGIDVKTTSLTFDTQV